MVDMAREIHAEAIARFGGSTGGAGNHPAGVGDGGAASDFWRTDRLPGFGGRTACRDLAEVAAAYLFYLCRNHPFIDGNKRTALGACVVFLRLNGIEPKSDGSEWEELTLAVASSEIERDEAAKWLRKLLPKAK